MDTENEDRHKQPPATEASSSIRRPTLGAKILVPADLSDFTDRAVEVAAELARLTGGAITLLTVVNDVYPFFEFYPTDYAAIDVFDAIRGRAEKQLQSLLRTHAHGLTTRIEVRRGYPAKEIVDYGAAEGFDLIVMATHGHSGLEHALLGSITEKVLRKAHCPVLVVR